HPPVRRFARDRQLADALEQVRTVAHSGQLTSSPLPSLVRPVPYRPRGSLLGSRMERGSGQPEPPESSAARCRKESFPISNTEFRGGSETPRTSDNRPKATENIRSSNQGFADLGVSRAVVRALSDRGFTEPFAIQKLVIGDVLAGRDVLAKSPTGSGKTLAFAVPL